MFELGFGPYRFIRRLGSGAMGTVYLAETEGRRVAVKILHPHLLEKPGYFKSFQREIRVGRRIDHPNVVRTFDGNMSVQDGVALCYVEMEYVEGRSLREFLIEEGTASEPLVREIGAQVAAGLTAIHDQHAVHRDIKPENVLITRDEIVKVMDFGVARVEDSWFDETAADRFRGTLSYAAPEALRSDGLPIDGRTDLFALGITLYELSTGCHPFAAEEFGEVVAKILEEDPPGIREIRSDLSPFLEEAVFRLLAKPREERFESAAALREFLTLEDRPERWQRERPRPPARAERRPSLPRETALHGREEELARLGELFERAQEGQGQAVLLEGPLGIGKTRLVDELVRRVRATGVTCHFLFGAYPPGGAASGLQGFTRALGDHLGQPLVPALRAVLSSAPGLVRPMASVIEGVPPPDGTAVPSRDVVQSGFTRVLKELAEDRLTIVLIDDLHYAPEDGRALFAAVVQAAERLPLLLVGTMRHRLPAVWQGEIERLDHVTHMLLEKLSTEAILEIAREALRTGELTHRLGDSLATRADGNPYFLFEILGQLRRQGDLTLAEAETPIEPEIVDTIEVPSVTVLVEAWLGEIEDDRALLEVAACHGHEFDPSVVAEVLEMALIPCLRRLDRIARQTGILRAHGRRFLFSHQPVHDVLVEGLPPALREAYHALIAKALVRLSGTDAASIHGALAAEVCEHYLEGDLPDRARPCLEAGLDHLESVHHREKALQLACRALDAEGLFAGAERVDLLLRVAGYRFYRGEHEAQREALEEAIRLADTDDVRSARALTMLGEMLVSTGGYEEAGDALEPAVARAAAGGDLEVEASAHNQLGNLHAVTGRVRDARVCYERCLELATEAENRRMVAAAGGNLGYVLAQAGEFEAAREHYERCLETFHELGERRAEGSAVGMLGHLLADLGRYEESAERHREHLAVSREIGYRRGEAIATANLGMALRRLGDLVGALRHSERSERISDEIGDRPGVAAARINRGVILMQLGRPADARPPLEQSLAECREIGAREDEGLGLLYLARLALTAGEDEEALGFVEEALAVFREIEFADGIGAALLRRGRTLDRLGRREAATASLREAVDLGREHRLTFPWIVGGCALALVGGMDVETAREWLREHGEQLDPEDRIDGFFTAWRAGGHEEDLRTAYDRLRALLSSVPADHRERMETGVPLHRAVIQAWKNAAGGDRREGTDDVEHEGE